MILAQNHRLPLSGNKLWVVAFSMLCFMSCATSKTLNPSNPKILKPGTEKTEVAVKEDNRIKVDTAQWRYISDDLSKPIQSASFSAFKGSVLSKVEKSVYNVALLMPFRGTQLDENNMKFAQFYAGFKLAAAKDSEVFIKIRTYTTERSADALKRIIADLELSLPDIIIGPYETELLQGIAEFAKKNRITIISPWKSSTKITENNPYFLQLRPNITDYYEQMIAHINANFDRSKVCILGRPGSQDNTKTRVLQKLNQDRASVPIVQPFREYLISQDTLMQTDSTVFTTEFSKGVEVFIIPHYIARDESYVYSCLRKLYAEKGNQQFYVYTMPLAINSDQVDLNILKNLNIRACEFKFVDMRNPVIQQLREKFFLEYGYLATEDAYFGYDVMEFLKKGLARDGQYFHYYMRDQTHDFSQMAIKVKAVSNNDDQLDYLVNAHMYLIEFDQDHFTAKTIQN